MTISEKIKSGFFFGLNVFLSVVLLLFVISWLFHKLRATGEVPPTIAAESSAVTPKSEIIQIEVLNGCGVNQLALRMTNYLRRHSDFDVVDFRDYERYDIPQTLVIDRVSMDTKYAGKVAQIIGVDARNIFPQLSQPRTADVTIIIGADYQNLTTFK